MELQSDSALTDPADDALGRAPFAKTLASAIAEMEAEDGFVFSLQGDWGSGKTTVINFVLHELRERSKPPVIVPFNPWWFSGRDQLIQQFFNALRSKLGGDSTAAQVGSLAADLDRFARVLTPLTFVPTLAEPVRSLRTILTGVSKSGRAIAETMAADAQVIRQQIDAKLRERGERIVVILDDLDRLPAYELRLIFQLVKAVADFPNTIYLLAYDHGVVASALDQEQGGTGSEYLAKIVQAPFDIPPPSQTALDDLLFKQLNQVLADTPEGHFDQVRWGNLYFGGIQDLIGTPRDIKRLMNGVRPAYPSVRNEVAADEFVAIQALRVFVPGLYSRVSVGKALLAGSVDRGDGADELRSRCDELLTVTPEPVRTPIDSILKRLFPRWRYAYGDSAHGPAWLAGWRREGRVCSPDVFDLYFSFSLAEEVIGLSEYRELIELSEQPEALGDRLREMVGTQLRNGKTRARVFLEGIQDFTDSEIRDEQILGFLRGVWLCGDALLISTDEGGMFELGNDMQVMRITHQLLKRLPSSEARRQALEVAFAPGTAPQLAVHELAVRYQGLDEHPEVTDDVIQRSHLDELKEMVVGQIQTAAESGSLTEFEDLGFVLYRWEEWSPGAAVAFASALVDTEVGFHAIVLAFTAQVRSAGMGDRVSRSSTRVRVDALEQFAGLSESELKQRATSALRALPAGAAPELREALELLASGRGSRAGRDD